MQIDKLQIELRPRTNAQALDLGFALLRSHARATYLAYIALWLPLVALAMLLTWWQPDYAPLFGLGLWWLKPLLERAPLYVLSRQVFGTAVGWREAVRAWPRQLGGGAFYLLTWGRPLAAGRGLFQPVWQLEMARGSVAKTRRRVLGLQNTAWSAFWFGTVCLQLELVLQMGLIAFLGNFTPQGLDGGPFALFEMHASGKYPLLPLLFIAIYGVAAAIIAPIYTACCFTLYLNRRASLEAWDLELQLRQITPPVSARNRQTAGMPAALAALLLALCCAAPPDSMAAAAPDTRCAAPESQADPIVRSPVRDADQARLRKELEELYRSDKIRGYECVETWRLKEVKKKKDKKKDDKDDDLKLPDLSLVASVLKVILIAGLVALIAWLVYRFRDRFPALRQTRSAAVATEVGGLDIRAESLPDDVAANARALWTRGQRREALALLYRATLSRLVTDDGLQLTQGNTEGDCLRLATAAQRAQRLSQGRLQVAIDTTDLWLGGAYAGRWPATEAVLARCGEWDAQFGRAGRPA